MSEVTEWLSKIIGLPLLFLTLAACIRSPEAPVSPLSDLPADFQEYESPMGYQVAVPIGFTYSQLAPSGKYYYFGYPIGSSTHLRTVELYDSISSSPCTPSLTGASKMSHLRAADWEAAWGRVDFWDHGMDYEPRTEPACPPAEGRDGKGYVMCSNKEGKTALICILQEVDDPQLAETIFKTFRWTR